MKPLLKQSKTLFFAVLKKRKYNKFVLHIDEIFSFNYEILNKILKIYTNFIFIIFNKNQLTKQ